MAQRVQVELVDDLNGEVAQETVRFGVDDTEYEIDLTTENAEKLRSALAEYVGKAPAARTGRKTQGGQQAASGSRPRRENTPQIRQWAQGNGYTTNPRGRIPEVLADAYNEAQK